MRRRALFLDRDGVINVDMGYVCRKEDFQWVDGVTETIRMANALKMPCIVVTNQAGIARGYYSESDFQALTTWMVAELEGKGATINAVYHCPYHQEGHGRYHHPDHPDRKPNPGMLLRAASELQVDLGGSAMIGDHESDILAGVRAGIPHLALFGEGACPPGYSGERVRTHLEARNWLKNAMAAPSPGSG